MLINMRLSLPNYQLFIFMLAGLEELFQFSFFIFFLLQTDDHGDQPKNTNSRIKNSSKNIRERHNLKNYNNRIEKNNDNNNQNYVSPPCIFLFCDYTAT